MIEVYDDLFAHDFLVDLYKTCVKKVDWQYTNTANRSQYPDGSILAKGSHNFFGRRIFSHKTRYNVENFAPDQFFEVLEHVVFNVLKKENLHLMAIDCNLQVMGQNGTSHRDVSLDNTVNDRTIMFYPHYEWKDEWGGALEIIENDKVIDKIFPYPGRVVYFDSSVHHRALAPDIPDIGRISIAYRLNELL